MSKRSINLYDVGDRLEITGLTQHDKTLPPAHNDSGRHKGKVGKVVGHTQLGTVEDAVHVLAVPREPTADNDATTEQVEVAFSSLSEAAA